MIVELLGTGTSHGVPKIGCDCPVCRSDDPRDKRMRSSAWIHSGDCSVVIDTGPEFRLQAIRAGIKRIDAVFYTHNHADHLNGIDDLRVFSEQHPLTVYGPAQVLEDIAKRFPYAVGENPWRGGLPQLILKSITADGVWVGPFHVLPVPMEHGCRSVYGYRIGSFAYLTDCKTISQEGYGLLAGVDTIIIDALRKAPHPTHMNIDEAIEAGRRLGARRVCFTHMTHRISHAALAAELPSGFEPAYDGMTIEFDEDKSGADHA